MLIPVYKDKYKKDYCQFINFDKLMFMFRIDDDIILKFEGDPDFRYLTPVDVYNTKETNELFEFSKNEFKKSRPILEIDSFLCRADLIEQVIFEDEDGWEFYFGNKYNFTLLKLEEFLKEDYCYDEEEMDGLEFIGKLHSLTPDKLEKYLEEVDWKC